MEKTAVQKLAAVVRVLVTVVLVCNIIALLLAPGIAGLVATGGIKVVVGDLSIRGQGALRWYATFFTEAWVYVWTELYLAIVTVYLLICGICTAVILWQARRVLGTVLRSEPFSLCNACSMRRAAVCCFVVSAVALIYEVFCLCFYRNEAVFLAVSIVVMFVFFIAGLICLVMSALFRQAAEMKAEQDLTI